MTYPGMLALHPLEEMKEMEDIMKMIKHLEDPGLLINNFRRY